MSDITLLGKSEEFNLYSFFSNELEQHFVLKVMGDRQMYETEKVIHEKLEGTKSTLKLVNAFTFELPEPDETGEKESQHYFIFE